MVEVQEQNAQQHQHRAGQRVQEELDRGVKLARPAPDADQQIHRHQHRFPENEEEEEIERHEDAEHAGLQHQKPDVVFLHAILNRRPRRQNRNPAQQRRQHDQQERNAVDAQHVTRADRGNPVVGRALDELEARLEALLPRTSGPAAAKSESPASAKMFAIQRMASLFSFGTNRRRSAPSSGVKRMIDRMWFCIGQLLAASF